MISPALTSPPSKNLVLEPLESEKMDEEEEVKKDESSCSSEEEEEEDSESETEAGTRHCLQLLLC